MKQRIILALTAMLMLAGATFAQNGGQGSSGITLTDQERQLIAGNNDFAFRLFRQVRGEESAVVSPLSITYALGMLNNGATGQTQQEINAVLGGSNASVDVINSFCRKMLTEASTLDEDTKVNIANNIYFNKDYADLKLKTAFKEAAANYYDATPSVVSFSDSQTVPTINQWVSDHTEGLIENLLNDGEINDLVSVLLNTIYFKGTWVYPFNENYTHDEYFDGTRATAKMMIGQTNTLNYSENDLYQSVVLPYGNGAYQMTLFLPQRGKTLDEMLAAMNGQDIQASNYEQHRVCVSMPRFETENTLGLNETMKALGMTNAFGGEGFSEFCYAGDDETDSWPVWISMMKQSARLKVTESGTEAAAVTIVEIAGSMSNQNTKWFTANRPFLYTISERSTGAIFFIGQYTGEAIRNVRKDISLTAEERQLVSDNNDFAFRLFREVRGEESTVMSPLSITYALGLLNNGATGQTQQEINTVLGGANASADVINAFCRKMLTEAPKLDEGTKAEIANTIFVNSGKGVELQPTFVETANAYYDAEPQSRDFYDGETMDVINQWANDHTHGMIPEVLNENSYNPDAVSYLLNAIYFKGCWTDKFDKSLTEDQPFNGGPKEPMMHRYGEYTYTDNDMYQAIILPYGNGAYQMTVFLPREGKTVADVAETLNGSNWSVYGESYEVDLKLPRFKTNADIPLVDVMSQLGMPSAFIPTLAEFPYLCKNRDVYISNMLQKAVINLDEDGTEAAAVTVIYVGDSAPGEPKVAVFHADRPFLYTISEISTGAIFFIGQYCGASGAAGRTDGIREVREKETVESEQLPDVIYDLQGRQIEKRKSENRKYPKGIYVVNGRKVALIF